MASEVAALPLDSLQNEGDGDVSIEESQERPYAEFVEKILFPKRFESFRETLQGNTVASVLISFHENPDSPEEITDSVELDDLYPTQTVYDLQTRIFMERGQLNRYHPMNQTLLLKKAGTIYSPFHFSINNKFTNIGNPLSEIQQEEKYNPNFVKEGVIQNVKIASYERVTLQTKLFYSPPPKDTYMYTIHVFLYDDILSRYAGVKSPMSPEEWAGKMKPFFPLREEQQPLEPMDTRVQQYLDRKKLLECLDTILREKELRQPGQTGRGDIVNLANFRILRFAWHPLPKSEAYEPIQIDYLFYSMPLSEVIPYVRFFPKQGVPLSKVFVKGALNIPAMDRPDILSKWAEDRSPTPEEDLLLFKVLMRPAAGSVPPLYGTFFVFASGAGKFVIQPNEGEKVLTRQLELVRLRDVLEFITKQIPKQQPSPKNPKRIEPRPLFSPETIYLDEAYTVFSMWLESKDMPITRENFQAVLPYFLPFVQVTNSPIQEQKPLLFLRYKGTDNFRTPSRDFQFLKTVYDLQSTKSVISIPALERYYQEEFDVTEQTAKARVATFLKGEMEYQVVNEELLSFEKKENPGLDIAIFGKHPTYTIHVYRVDDLYAYRNILTLLSVLVSVEPEDFGTYCDDSARRSLLTSQKEQLAAEEAAAAKTAAVVSTASTPDQPLAKSVLLGIQSASQEIPQGEYNDDYSDLEEEDFVGIAKPAVTSGEDAIPLTQGQAAAAAIPLSTLVQEDAPDESDDTETELAAVIKDQTELQKIPANRYFGDRLRFFDRRLFTYGKSAGVKQYPRMCSSPALRQPTVISEDAYKRMREEYEPDEEKGFVQFIEFPMKPPEKGKVYDKTYDKRKTERITVLRYGSGLSSGFANYYLCSLLWCRKDEMVILKRDFDSDKDRNKKDKPKFTCPFCRGRAVTSRDSYVEGETVITRDIKGGKKPHTFIQFLTTGQHPEGFHLPCCFLSDKATYTTHPAFKAPTSVRPLKVTASPFDDATEESAKPSQTLQQITEEESLEDEDDDGVDSTAPLFKVNYQQRLEQMLDKKPYITKAEKFPLEIRQDGPQIGVLSPAQDKYFAQTSIPGLVKQDHTVWRLITDDVRADDKRKGEVAVSGFLRIAVDNRKRVQAESFLASVAPVLGFNSTIELKNDMLNKMTLRLYMQLNYGNLLLEFYDPNFKLPGYNPVKQKEYLSTFIKDNLTDKIIPGANTESLMRAAKSWYRFREIFLDIDYVKEYRQFAPLFATPGYFTPNGVLFIVLETSASGGVTIRCPPYGVSEEAANRCDIAFLSYTPKSRIWEPIFYTKNNARTAEHSNQFLFPGDARDTWPPIVRARAQEFYDLCKSSGLGLYTDSPGVNPDTLIPLGKALGAPLGENESVFAVLRDAYNHVSAVIYSLEDNHLVFVHVIDDGTPHASFRVEFDWENNLFRSADLDQTLSFYTKTILPLAESLGEQVKNQYTPKEPFKMQTAKTKVVKDATTYVYGLSFLGGLNIPIRKPLTETVPYTVKQVQSWQMDKKLVFGEKEASVQMQMSNQEFQEVFQHLRLTFSNWFAFEATRETKEHVQSILFDQEGYMNTSIPLWEKRVMLKIMLGSVVMSWLDSSLPVVGRQPSVRREDCHLKRSKEICSNFCVWKEETSQCLLHVPEMIPLGMDMVPAREVLLARLLEELIRFPLQGQQLLKQKVSHYQKLRDAFRTGNQYIVAENMPAWTELLRTTWLEEVYEQPKFFEELRVGSESAKEEEKEEENENKPAFVLPVLPPVLSPLFQTKANSLFYFSTNILEALGDMHVNLFALITETDMALESTVPTTIEQVQWIAKQLQLSVMVIPYESEIAPTDEIMIARVRLPNKQFAPFVCMVLLPNGQTGLVSPSSERIEPIPFDSFPKSLQARIRVKGKNAVVLSLNVD